MSNEIIESGTRALLQVPDLGLTVRLATLEDVAWIDSMQKRDSKALGFMPMGQIEGKVVKGNVLVAETIGAGPSLARSDATAFELRPGTGEPARDVPAPDRLGYIIGPDAHFLADAGAGRDDAVLVSESDDGWGDSGGSTGVADSAGNRMV